LEGKGSIEFKEKVGREDLMGEMRNIILQGHILEELAKISDESIHCCVTSPPYFGLRDYGLEPQIWDEGDGCGHEWEDCRIVSNSGGGWNNPETRGNYPTMRLKNPEKENKSMVSQGSFCKLCGAWRGSLGLEPTPELYVKHMVEIFREVRRALRKDGTLWLNLGSCYAGSGSPGGDFRNGKGGDTYLRPYNRMPSGFKPKDLIPIPWMVAMALQANGWYLRSDIIWSKPNPMPESVTDRPTTSHEYIFLLAKSRHYYYDQEAVRKPNTSATVERAEYHWCNPGTKASTYQELKGINRDEPYPINPAGRNLRSVWTFATQNFPEAHFATFPEELARRCILAGTSAKGCCPKCGAGWKRIVEKQNPGHTGKTESIYPEETKAKRLALLRQAARENGEEYVNRSTTLGFFPSCSCNVGPPIPCIVLDPFLGSGTTAKVARDLCRDYIGIELKKEYIEIAERRIATARPQMEIL